MKWPSVMVAARSLYVAASSHEIKRARRCMDLARARGFRISCDWTAAIDEAGGVANPVGATEADCRTWATMDLEGVRRANFFWLLYPEEGSGRGAFFEFGAAWAAGKTLVVSGPSHRTSIFSALADMRTTRDDDALAYLERATGHA